MCAQALCLAVGSDPEKGTEKKMGAYLMVTMFQTSCITSGMFITAMVRERDMHTPIPSDVVPPGDLSARLTPH